MAAGYPQPRLLANAVFDHAQKLQNQSIWPVAAMESTRILRMCCYVASHWEAVPYMVMWAKANRKAAAAAFNRKIFPWIIHFCNEDHDSWHSGHLHMHYCIILLITSIKLYGYYVFLGKDVYIDSKKYIRVLCMSRIGVDSVSADNPRDWERDQSWPSINANVLCTYTLMILYP